VEKNHIVVEACTAENEAWPEPKKAVASFGKSQLMTKDQGQGSSFSHAISRWFNHQMHGVILQSGPDKWPLWSKDAMMAGVILE